MKKILWICLLCFATLYVFAQNDAVRRKILIGGDHNYPPYEFLDRDRKPTGFCVDIVNAVFSEINLEPEFWFNDWALIRTMFENKKIDMLEGMLKSEERAKIYLFSDPIVTLEFTFFARKNGTKFTSVNDLQGKSILVQNRDIMHEKLLELGLVGEVVPVANPIEALKTLSAGKHDFAATVRIMGYYVMREYNLNNIISVDTTFHRLDYCFAVNKKDSLLLNELNKGIRAIKSKGVYNSIYDKWFGVMKPAVSYNDILRYALWIIIPVFIILLIIYLWMKTLKRQVKIKTAELNKELEERKVIERKLEKEKEQLSVTINSRGEAIICTDSEGVTTLLNPSALELLGRKNRHENLKFDEIVRLRY